MGKSTTTSHKEEPGAVSRPGTLRKFQFDEYPICNRLSINKVFRAVRHLLNRVL
jgi:hypothetical protein